MGGMGFEEGVSFAVASPKKRKEGKERTKNNKNKLFLLTYEGSDLRSKNHYTAGPSVT